MRASKLVIVGLAVVLFVIASARQSFAGMALYEGRWIAESFGNDRVNIGTEESQYFEVLGIPQGINCHDIAPLCDITSTPSTGAGAWNPLGPSCRPLTALEKPRPAKNETLTPSGARCTGTPGAVHTGTNPTPTLIPLRPHTRGGFTTTIGAQAVPCDKTPPLYRNTAFTAGGGAPDNQTCEADDTVALGVTNVYLGPGNAKRGIAMKGAPLTGSGVATTTGTSFKFPAAKAAPGPPFGMRRTTEGSFIGEGPYLYSYTYANLRNDAGSFGPGKGFFSVAAPGAPLTFKNNQGINIFARVTVTPHANRFGGVMKLLGTYRNKVCYFYGGGCGLGIGTWGYQDIGTAGYKAGGVVTASWTTSFLQVYYNTQLGTFAKYDVVEQRFPWTTGTVTVSATARGPNKTFEKRVGFDNRVDGVGTVQLVSPLLTQWLGQFGAAAKFETGGIGVMQIKFIPEPSVNIGLVACLLGLAVLKRFRRS